MFEELEKLQQHFIDCGVPGNDCEVFYDGKEVYRKQFGYSDLEKRIPMCGDEVYNIYSCSKPITCAAALQLLENGKIRLEDKLCYYIPEYKYMSVRDGQTLRGAKRDITIKNLFCMTAGFSYDTNSPAIIKARDETGGKCPTVDTVRRLASEPLLFDPEERFEYSLCHDVLAAVIEIVSGERFGSYVSKHIFEPLGMNNSSFSLPDEARHTLCEQYRYDMKDGTMKNCGKGNQNFSSECMPYKLGSEYESGGAGCVSTVNDYIKFLEALRAGKIIKNETVDLMSTDMLTNQQKRNYWVTDYGYGLGVRCPDSTNKKTDFGWGGAAGAYLAVDRKNKLSVYYAQHVLNSPNQEMQNDIIIAVKKSMSLF